jgi:hypothetical protein
MAATRDLPKLGSSCTTGSDRQRGCFVKKKIWDRILYFSAFAGLRGD